MKTLASLLENNRRWAADVTAQRPDFFRRLAAQQVPEYMWIGCADSRVPANEIVGLDPGELFVHRNVANVVVHTDLNCLSALQFAIDALNVKHVIVTGHYGCSGVRAALNDTKLGLIDNWLRHVQDVRNQHRARLDRIAPAAREDRLAELNVIEQALHICETTSVQDAWARGQAVAVHSWIYGLKDGRLHDLGFSAESAVGVAAAYRTAIDALESTR
jgi:carbonic anhydrase